MIRIDEKMIRLGDDLVAAIVKCNPGWMKHPTIHMRDAIINWQDHIAEVTRE